MSGAAAAPLQRLRTRAEASPLAATVVGLALMVAFSIWLRTQAIDAKFWIDEGLSVGLADRPLTEIPGVLRQDGSPPLYYVLLHAWIELTGGSGEARTHALSLLFALLTIPAAFLCARELFEIRTAWAAAALATFNPFITFYAQETRMYALVVLLSLLAGAFFALAFAHRRRAFLPAFSVAATLLVYTHNWGLFFVAGTVAAVLVVLGTTPAAERRPLLRDALLAFGAIAVLYAPWLPSLLFQAQHTGAPWSERPPLDAILSGLQATLGGPGPAILAGAVGLAGLGALRAESEARRRTVQLIAVAVGAALVLTWTASQVSPAWANRYFSVFVGPILLLLAPGLVRFGRFGLVALGIVLVLWIDGRETQLKGKSNVYKVTTTLEERALVDRGDMIVNTHPEHGPVVRYYLGEGFRWANALGPVADPRYFDWRDALDKLEVTGPKRVMRELAPRLTPGQRLVLFQPIIRSSKWGAPWTSLVRRRAAQWERELDHHPLLRRLEPVPKFRRRALPRGVRAVVYAVR